MLPLKDIVVLEMAGLAPAPFAGLILSDFGANVIRIDRPSSFNTDVLTRYIKYHFFSVYMFIYNWTCTEVNDP